MAAPRRRTLSHKIGGREGLAASEAEQRTETQFQQQILMLQKEAETEKRLAELRIHSMEQADKHSPQGCFCSSQLARNFIEVLFHATVSTIQRVAVAQ